MKRQDAEREAQRLNAALPAASRQRWFVSPAPAGGWGLVKVANLPAGIGGPMKTTTDAKPRPPMADDPRPAHWRNTGGPWAPWGL